MERIDDLWKDVERLLVSQYGESPNLRKLLKICVNAFQAAENFSSILDAAFDVDNAADFWLDRIGALKNVSRLSGEKDDDYRARILEAFGANTAGTPDYVIRAAKTLSGDDSPQYMDEVPATFFVYTPGGKQIRRARLQRLAPAGVLALPGAAIDAGGGNRKRLATADGKIILVAAPEAVSMRLTAETGERIADENGNTLRTEGT